MAQSHALSHLLGQRLVNSLPIPERRKSKDELAAMSHDERLNYEIRHPLSDAEKQEALEREDRDVGADETGEIDPRDLLDNQPPADWGT
jgi:hypothetical protein